MQKTFSFIQIAGIDFQWNIFSFLGFVAQFTYVEYPHSCCRSFTTISFALPFLVLICFIFIFICFFFLLLSLRVTFSCKCQEIPCRSLDDGVCVALLCSVMLFVFSSFLVTILFCVVVAVVTLKKNIPWNNFLFLFVAFFFLFFFFLPFSVDDGFSLIFWEFCYALSYLSQRDQFNAVIILSLLCFVVCIMKISCSRFRFCSLSFLMWTFILVFVIIVIHTHTHTYMHAYIYHISPQILWQKRTWP